MGGVTVATLTNFVGNVADFEQRRAALLRGDEGTDALHPGNGALAGQFAQGAVRGHPADPEIRDDVVFGGDAMMRRPLAAFDTATDELLHRFITRDRPILKGGYIAFALH